MEGGIKYKDPHTKTYPEKKNRLSFYTGRSTGLFVVIFLILFVGQSCDEAEKPTAPPVENRDSIAVMQTEGVTTLISDSGIIKYRIVTASWDIYDRTEIPHWTFKKGLYVEQFDRDYTVTATIKSDTAYYYTQQKLWELRGNVQIKNVKGDKFFTSLLFWDQNTERVYSHKKIRIEQSDKTIHGDSFESNQDMTKYTIYNTVGHVTFDEDKLQKPQYPDTLQNPVDSLPPLPPTVQGSGTTGPQHPSDTLQTQP